VGPVEEESVEYLAEQEKVLSMMTWMGTGQTIPAKIYLREGRLVVPSVEVAVAIAKEANVSPEHALHRIRRLSQVRALLRATPVALLRLSLPVQDRA